MNCRLPVPSFTVVSTVMDPIGEGLRPCSKNIVARNASASIGVGLGAGVGFATGVAVGVGVGDATERVLVETEPQPASNNKIPESKKTIALRKRRPPGPGQAEGSYP